MTDADRAIRAFSDVLAVEWDDEAGVARIVTLSDCYMAVPEAGQHLCPDRKHNLNGEGRCKHLVALDAVRGRLDIPSGWFETDDLDDRSDPEFPVSTELPDFEDFRTHEVVTDGAGEQVPVGMDKWTVLDRENTKAHHYDDRATADDKLDMADSLGITADLFPPGQLPGGEYENATEGAGAVDTDAEPNGPEPHTSDQTDDTPDETPTERVDTVEAEVVDHAPDAGDDAQPDTDHEPEYEDLPDRNVGEDPLKWVPGEFVDEIDGSQAINRRGFEVLSHFYDIEVSADVQVPPEDTGHKYCRVQAVAETPDGRRCEAHGSAHVDRGDDHYLLLEMADTRARKRALSIATGVGAVAVEELRNEVEQ